MYQMQRLFGYLQETERRFYNPEPFVNTIKDGGQPTDVFVQKDASEFLTGLFQQVRLVCVSGVVMCSSHTLSWRFALFSCCCAQIENATSGTKSEKMLRDNFGGTLSAELIADGGHYSESEEMFYFLSVSVKNMQCLQVPHTESGHPPAPINRLWPDILCPTSGLFAELHF